MDDVILAIDSGTSGTKSIVLDGEDKILSIVETPIRPVYSSGGSVEQDPQELWSSVVGTARDAAAEAGVPISCIALSNQGESVLAWNRDTGEPVGNIVVWQDSRATEIARERANYKDVILRRTGLTLDPYFTAPKITWLYQQLSKSGSFSSRDVITTTDTWLLYRLTGEFVTDASTASRSMLKPLDSVSWDTELCEIFDIKDSWLPKIVANDEIIGSTDVLGYPVKVAGAVVDQQAALLAESCFNPGDAKCTFGTGAFLLANAGTKPPESKSGLTVCTAWVVDGVQTYCFDGQVYTSGSAVRWLQDIGIISAASELDSVAVDDTGGVIFIPALAGMGSPWWWSEPGGAFQGLSLATGKGELVGSVLQGIAANVAVILGLVGDESDAPVIRLRVDGGLTRSQFLVQSVANLAQVDVEVFASPHATPLGAAAFARKALHPSVPLEDCVPVWQAAASVSPLWTREHAQKFLNTWVSSVDALDERRRVATS